MTNRYAVQNSEQKKRNLFFLEKMFFSFDTIETNNTIIKLEAFIESDDVKFLLARSENIVYYMLYQKHVPYNEEMEEAEDVYECF